MAIFIKGKTRCRICGQVLTSNAGIVGFPNTKLPVGLGELADSCVHRSCLDAHARRDELLQAWKQHWLAQAELAGADALVNRHGVFIFNKRRFTFAALDSFIELEDQLEVLDQLRVFFSSFNGREQLSTVTTWNTYELTPSSVGARLLVTANALPSAALRAAQENAVLDYACTGERWTGLVHGWGELTSK
ncbi:MAG: hypothetical protein QM772_04575 [Ottowia sp.]|uniref:hypothetical protein n=1 Tax=Ottowia sp. TaxID=1898956 RepID=UPI0039E6BB42